MADHETRLDHYAGMINSALERMLPQRPMPQAKLLEAVRYSLLDGGKRIRPVLLLEFCRISGGSPEDALPFACALEMIHTYSLIHDDLPCMDDDDTRRGRPASHVAFGEATAVLAGDALLTAAFETMLDPEYTAGIPPERVIRAAHALARAAGIYGMAGGQQLDMEAGAGGPHASDLIHTLKTGALIGAAAETGCILAGADAKRTEGALAYAKAVGRAFQLVDDILDGQGGETQFAAAEKLTREAAGYLDVFAERVFLTWLAEKLLMRRR